MQQRKTKFNHELDKEFGLISRKKDDIHVFCTVSHCDVVIGNNGKSEVY